MSLLVASDCIVVCIDGQDGFYGPHRADVDRNAFGSALARAGWVCGVAAGLEIPIIVTEEDADRNGSTAQCIRQHLPSGTPVFAKAVFGAHDETEIDSAVESSGRSTVVLVGVETDVCVLQSALGWAARGRRIVVVRDAVYSAGQGHGFGLQRLAESGVELISAKGLYYEWLRTLAAVRQFDAAHPDLAEPPGFSL